MGVPTSEVGYTPAMPRREDHVGALDKKKIKKNVLNGNVYTTRPVGRPRNRWADVVQKDALQVLGIRGWRTRAENWDKWRRLMGEVKVWKGL